MNANFMIVECENNHKFRLGLTDDGYRDCPECGKFLKGPYQSTKEDVRSMKTIGQAWRDKRKAESNKPKQTIQIDVEMNTDKMQLKLRTIAKHAEALANELDAIDKFTDDNELPSQLEGSD